MSTSVSRASSPSGKTRVAGSSASDSGGRRDALAQLQSAHGGQFVEFAGHSTPMRYADGIIKEHLHARAAAGLFDVSHMNQARIEGAGAGQALEKLLPCDALSMPIGRLRYTVLTNSGGGIIDDLILGRLDDGSYTIVTNACRAGYVNRYLRESLDGQAGFRVIEDHSLLALQGPQARAVIAKLSSEAGKLRKMHAARATLLGHECLVSCAGYTGEDGFEISLARDAAAGLAAELLAFDSVRWCGLGARDSLRLEAGLCLYARDIDETTTPVEAGLAWTIPAARRTGGARAGGFPGAGTILAQLGADKPDRNLSGLIGKERGVARQSAPLYASADGKGQALGIISSGGYSPSLKSSIALAWLPGDLAPGATVYAKVRNSFLAYQLSPTPFYTPALGRPESPSSP